MKIVACGNIRGSIILNSFKEHMHVGIFNLVCTSVRDLKLQFYATIEKTDLL